MSTNPGATILPVASIVSAASPASGGSAGPRRRTSTILPALTATSASNRSAPVPSTTVPPVILTSNTSTPLGVLGQPLRWQCNIVTDGGGSASMTTQKLVCEGRMRVRLATPGYQTLRRHFERSLELPGA